MTRPTIAEQIERVRAEREAFARLREEDPDRARELALARLRRLGLVDDDTD